MPIHEISWKNHAGARIMNFLVPKTKTVLCITVLGQEPLYLIMTYYNKLNQIKVSVLNLILFTVDWRGAISFKCSSPPL